MNATRKLLSIMIALMYTGAALAEGDSKVTIRGQVIYEPTGKPLQNVTVNLLRPDRSRMTLLKNLGHEGVPETLGVTKTDANGYFSFETISRGPYEISCFRRGPHFGDGMLNVDPKKFALIRYKADPAPEIWGPPHGRRK